MNLKPSKDKVYRKVERSEENIQKVTGTTSVNHKIRVRLGLSLREYVLLDFLTKWHFKNKEAVTYGDIWKATGIYIRFVDRMYQRLKGKGLLFKDVDGKVKTTELWNGSFSNSEDFEELWKIMHTGTKNVAKSAFDKAVKVDSFENIKNGLVEYVKFKEEIGQFPVHLSTFLNYKNKIWEGPFDKSPYIKKDKTFDQPKVQTGPKSKL